MGVGLGVDVGARLRGRVAVGVGWEERSQAAARSRMVRERRV
jgi:hypothetical protein